MNTTEYVQKILEELTETSLRIDGQSCDKLVKQILSSKQIFVAGAGRSGLMVKAFAMRLMHAGLKAYVVGETIAPSIHAGDLLLIASGSGETGSLAAMAQKAKKMNCVVALISIFPKSTIGNLADYIVEIPAPTPKAIMKTSYTSIQPMGSLFEQSLLLILDGMVMAVMDKTGMDAEEMFKRHASLE